MKKIFCLLATIFISFQMLLAIPSGVYCDSRGKQKVVVQGETIYCLDNSGNVRSTWMVVNEESNGRFSIKPVVNGQPYGSANSDNAWWNENGRIYLNLANQSGTLIRN